jgi:rhodanese-related sulfurtransferase
MKNTKILLLSLLSAFLFFASCEDEETSTPINEAQILAEHLGEFVNTDPFPAMIKSTDVNSAVLTQSTDMYIIDIRDTETFNAGHINGAVNVAFGDLLTHYETNALDTKATVAIVCFSGQTASYGASLLRMLGYTNVKAMKWGMSSWNEATKGSWVSKISNAKATQMVTEAGIKNAEGELPELNTGKTTGEAILRARVEELFEAGFGTATITNADAFLNSSTNYTVNYWGEEHYNVGHIPGAVQYTPKASFSFIQELNTLPTDKTVVVYCYTGQTSAFMAAYLNVLGYDAKTLLYGANGMMYDVMKDYTGTTAFTIFKEDSDVHDYTLIVE